MAAVLACGAEAALSHGTAADRWAVAPSASRTIHVTVPSYAGRVVPGLAIHRSMTLLPFEVTMVDGLPCTSVARTLLDLTDLFSVERLARAIEAADRLRLLDGVALERALARAGGRSAGRRLRVALAAYTGEPAPVRSELERRALELFTHAGLPRPRVNTLVLTAEGPLEVDFCWPDRRLVVEADSYEFHGTPAAFERDRRRDQLLKAAGWERLRITWRQVNEHPQQVIEAMDPGSGHR